MAYPAASLVTHFRRHPIPRSVNFATVGTVLAQLLTSAFDRYYKQRVNGTVTRKDFWDSNTTKNFCESSKCLNNSQQCHDQGECYSESYQNLSDYTGVRLSHMAMEQSKKNYAGPFVFNDSLLDTEDKYFSFLSEVSTARTALMKLKIELFKKGKMTKNTRP
uniref:Peptidase M13 C-terminal domain-containing protein n=1 Tax=Rhipicephalus microplus TaxID=6941 RepID=A0A6G4ZYK6_RHIMP